MRDIHRRGHEVASHGSLHELCYDLSSADLQNDLLKSRELLEDLLGHPVKGYRAPSFSINHEVLRAIRKSGYRYDSSYNSFGLHGRYGHIDLSANSGLCRGNECDNNGIAVPMLDDLMELPISNLTWAGRTLPWGGGGYFRLMPFFLMAWGMRRILNRDRAYVFYMHPWEIDPNQPRVWQASPSYRFRHYVNLDHTLAKLERLLNSFSDSRFITCDQYLAQTKGGAFNPRADASHTSSEVQS